MKPGINKDKKAYMINKGTKSGTLLLMGFILFVGFIWGRAFDPAGPCNEPKDRLQNYSGPEVPIGEYDEMVSVDVIRNSDDIWVVNHYTGDLIFEYNRFKEADKEAWQEYEDLLIEVGSKR